MNWKDLLYNPPKEYRSIPFWSLNDRLEPEEIRWQVDEMKKAGLGGYFMHARSGLKTPYMEDEWMQAIDAGIDEGKKQDISPWLYDEDGWPSGFAGGAITALGIEYQQKWLECHEVGEEEFKPNDRTLGAFSINEKSGTFEVVYLYNTGFSTSWEASGKAILNSKLVHVYWAVNPYYVDTLDPKVIKAFIDSTHEAYKSKFGGEFGKSIPGIFTDEPQYRGYTGPWSFVLEEEFEKEHGYSIITVLPALFYNIGSFRAVRYDFWKTVNRLFTTAFSRQISEWCEQNQLIHTGHVVSEDSLIAQVVCTGGAMTFYQYMQLPGIDWLFRWTGNPLTPKQVSSVIHQLGQKFAITETFGCAGWNVSFEELKWIAEWQYVLGINLMCQHLQWYSMKGLRKRDYPASLYYQQPWWEDYRLFNDYFGRLSVLLSEGKHMADILVLHPIRSAWSSYKPVDNGEIHDLDTGLAEISTWLLEIHRDYDYGDEEILVRYAGVENGALVVGQAEYRLVLIPPAISLDLNTVELLEEFITAGGKVISVGRYPELCEGRVSSRMDALREKVVCIPKDKAALRSQINTILPMSIEVLEETGADAATIYYQMRRMGAGEQVLYLVNTSNTRAVKTKVHVSGCWNVEHCTLEDGRTVLMNVYQKNKVTEMELQFEPIQSYALILSEKAGESEGCIRIDRYPNDRDGCLEASNLVTGEEWKLTLKDYNALTIDYACLSIDGGAWSEKTPTIQIQEDLLKLGRPAEVALKFEFDIHSDTSEMDELYLAVEEPEQFIMEINGRPLQYADMGWWRDKCLRKVDIKDYVQCGTNTVILRLKFSCSDKVYKLLTTPGIHEAELNKITYDVEIESVYIIGKFGVFSTSEYSSGEKSAVFTPGPFFIGKQPDTACTGDLTPQGMCFYAGNALLQQIMELPELNEKQRVTMNLGSKPSAVLFKIWVNGEQAGIVAWAPYKADITKYIKPGKNEIGIELMGSCRNLLGPHHHVLGEIHAVGPSSFTAHKGWIEWHLEDPNIWRDRYCFTRFGLEENPVVRVEG